jgi:hypothetical protein
MRVHHTITQKAVTSSILLPEICIIPRVGLVNTLRELQTKSSHILEATNNFKSLLEVLLFPSGLIRYNLWGEGGKGLYMITYLF